MQVVHRSAVVDLTKRIATETRLSDISIGGVTQGILSTWSKTQQSLDLKMREMKGPARDLFDLQRMTSSLQLQTECVSRAADSVGSTIRKIQQLGGQ